MLKKVKTIFTYIFFRTANYYAHPYPKTSKYGIAHGGIGVTVFLISVGVYFHFLMCVLLFFLNIDITMFGNFAFQLLSFIPSILFSKRIDRKYLGGLMGWIKANKRDSAWEIKGWCVCFFYFFIIIQFYIQYCIHCLILGLPIIDWQTPAYLHFQHGF